MFASAAFLQGVLRNQSVIEPAITASEKVCKQTGRPHWGYRHRPPKIRRARQRNHHSPMVLAASRRQQPPCGLRRTVAQARQWPPRARPRPGLRRSSILVDQNHRIAHIMPASAYHPGSSRRSRTAGWRRFKPSVRAIEPAAGDEHQNQPRKLAAGSAARSA